ncbi:MAG: UPF0149 family protein [Paracoccaceae bacterium]|nr:UPF0149 family protein [Paracoccaceae bacterium]
MTDQDLDLIDGFLGQVKGGPIQNAEALDGFFAALACCPDLIMPSEFMPLLQEGENEESDLVFDDMEEAQHFMAVIMSHWNSVNDQLNSDDAYLPVLNEDKNGISLANDWANGFLKGAHLRWKIWSDLLEDEERGGSLVPILALAHENHPDPEMRPYKEPIGEERRNDLILSAAAGVMRMHAMFLHQREAFLPDSDTFVHTQPKTGRNEPCPCGSEKKFKKCCGVGPTIH